MRTYRCEACATAAGDLPRPLPTIPLRGTPAQPRHSETHLWSQRTKPCHGVLDDPSTSAYRAHFDSDAVCVVEYESGDRHSTNVILLLDQRIGAMGHFGARSAQIAPYHTRWSTEPYRAHHPVRVRIRREDAYTRLRVRRPARHGPAGGDASENHR
jgi:hypothetical protein